MAERNSAIRTFALTTSAYTQIVAPIQCSFFEIIGTSDGTAMTRSSDGTDANSYPFPAAGWYGFGAPLGPASGHVQTLRWQAGETVTYLKAAIGTPNVYVEFNL